MNVSALIKPLTAAWVGICAIAAPALALPSAESGIENYIGVGVRAGLNDDTAAVIDSKLEVVSFEQGSVSVRPALLVGDDFESRLPVSFDLPLEEQFLVFGGGGFAYNFDSSDFDPMITGGLDMALSDRLILNVEGNLIFKSNDTDAEVAASVNWLF
ncbi:nucleoside-specific channel-forming tsx [Leptolyngbya sp. Heron Island J]|uniref:hypothetical protein n=1 Tax=Leptolyngbya sp. Heron Island J TaxID=1385935 RepID=UPI0003B9B487|nr:hypothetical protein [Leptolyngbya sp. Heron Island J]ESA34401.1 nucleoside-specific channel-forming tsx [Leptolyngbya sp. Heron Island J]